MAGSERLARLSMSLLLAISLIPTTFATAGTIRHDRDDANYLALAADYPSVGKLIVIGGTDGSATLIQQNYVLTAAHVAENIIIPLCIIV